MITGNNCLLLGLLSLASICEVTQWVVAIIWPLTLVGNMWLKFENITQGFKGSFQEVWFNRFGCICCYVKKA